MGQVRSSNILPCSHPNLKLATTSSTSTTTTTTTTTGLVSKYQPNQPSSSSSTTRQPPSSTLRAPVPPSKPTSTIPQQQDNGGIGQYDGGFERDEKNRLEAPRGDAAKLLALDSSTSGLSVHSFSSLFSLFPPHKTERSLSHIVIAQHLLLLSPLSR